MEQYADVPTEGDTQVTAIQNYYRSTCRNTGDITRIGKQDTLQKESHLLL